MTIADCGFPPLLSIPDTDPPETVPGRDLLVQHGPTAWVEIGFSAELFDPDADVVRRAIADIHAQPISNQLVGALIDTGATESCIDEELAQQLQLPLIDRQHGSGIGGIEQFNVYLGHIRIAALGYLQYGRFMGVRLAAGEQPHRALLGRTLL